MTTQVRLLVSGVDDDPERLEQATASLRVELLEFAEDVQQLHEEKAPPGTRAIDAAVLGSLLITIASGIETLPLMVTAVREWLSRTRGQPLTAELVIGEDRLTVTGITEASQERLIEAWLRVHAWDRTRED